MPELRGVPAARFSVPGAAVERDYPRLIVDHRVERDVALEMYRVAR